MLAANREYIYLLRQEIQRVEKENPGAELSVDKLRIMDSFLREASRLNPLDGRKCQYCSKLPWLNPPLGGKNFRPMGHERPLLTQNQVQLPEHG